MGPMYWPSDSGRWGTKGVELIQCVDGRVPQILKVWSIGSNGMLREVRPTEQVDVSAGTVGQFLTNYLAENGRIIRILSQISIDESVKFLGIPLFPQNQWTHIYLEYHGTTG